jgi:membrane protein DedA with SNARE-associated domain/membrane-associated phospholipid phosphatase
MTQFFLSLAAYIGSHPYLAILIVFLISAGEAVFVIGLFVPSTVVLVAAGTLIGTGQLSFWPIFIATALGAIVGDALSYWIGHVWKERIRTIWPFSRYTGMLDSGEAFFAKHGVKSIFIGRFIPGVKAVIPGIAGIVGMNYISFSVVNVVSAFAWAGAHILPAILVGRGLKVSSIANPHQMVLIGVLAAGLVLIWYAIKIILGFGLPYLNRIRSGLIDRFSRKPSAASGNVIRLLKNDESALAEFAYVSAAFAAFAGLVLITLAILYEPGIAAFDRSISGFAQTLRNSSSDQFFTLVTMLGDSFVITVMGVALVAGLLVWRHWQAALICAVSLVATALFVPFAKSLLLRSRPIPLYSGSEAFSFPSGHAALSAVLYGLIAVICAQNLPQRWRGRIYAFTAAWIAMIGFSRIYLQAHWPSDVAAGFLFGAGVISIVAFVLHNRRLTGSTGVLALLLAATILVAYPFHVQSAFTRALAQYSVKLPTQSMNREQWIADGWRSVPASRTLLVGDTAEPLFIQTTLDVSQIAPLFERQGWFHSGYSWSDGIFNSIVPTRQPLAGFAPLPNTNSGHAAVLTLTKLAKPGADSRQVLRFWKSGWGIGSGPRAVPLMVGSVTTETRDTLGFGFATVEQSASDVADTSAMSAIEKYDFPAFGFVSVQKDGALLLANKLPL